jgi:hypothetical protein
MCERIRATTQESCCIPSNSFSLNSAEELTADEHLLTLMKQIQISEIEVQISRRVSGLLPTTRLPSALVSENQRFNCVF